MRVNGCHPQSGRLFFLLCLLWSNSTDSAISYSEFLITGTPAAPAETADTPQKARGLLKGILERDGTPLHGYVGGQVFQNRERRLPRGRYREYDVNPRPRTGRRDGERLIIEQGTGQAYYTPDHYRTFVPLN